MTPLEKAPSLPSINPRYLNMERVQRTKTVPMVADHVTPDENTEVAEEGRVEQDGVMEEVAYGLMPRTAWIFRLMERAGMGPRSARSMQWFDNDSGSYQHHAEYLKRLSKLREELINQEQTNLANALERLRMRSYGKEYIFSRPKEGKRVIGGKLPVVQEGQRQRKTLITTLEKFQKMRPKKVPPKIMPLEGKSLLEKQVNEMPYPPRDERENGANTERSIDESVRLNLQRISTHPTPSIPRGKAPSGHQNIYVESNQIKRNHLDNNNSSAMEEKVARKHQRTFRMKHEVDKLKLTPQSFKLDVPDEDNMDINALRDYYCVYYIPAPAPSPSRELEGHTTVLPSIGSHCSHGEISPKSSRHSLDGKLGHRHVPFRSGAEFALPPPPCTCNCSCRMLITGNRVEAPYGTAVDENGNIFNNKSETGSRKSDNGNGSSHQGSRKSERSSNHHGEPRVANGEHRVTNGGLEKRQIVVDMPSIVFNTVAPDQIAAEQEAHGLVKAFKQKEIRQRELSNLLEDVRELNKRTETLSESVQ